MDSRRSDDEQQQRTQTTTADAAQQPANGVASSNAETAPRRSDPPATPAHPSETDASSAITAKLAKLEEHLKSIGKTLTLHTGKEEVLTRSLVDLESKIKKLERSLKEMIPPKDAAPVTVQKMEREPDYAASHGSVDDTKQQAQQSQTSASRTEKERTEQWTPSSDFPSPGLADHEDTSSFFSDSADVFDASTDTENQALPDDRFVRSGGAGKKPYLIIAPVLGLLALFLFLVFYYNDLQKQADKKLTITEPISISSIPVATVTSQPALPSGDTKQPEPKPDLSDAAAPSTAAIPATQTKDAVPSAIPLHENAVKGGFAVSVGAFKEKSNAMKLTSELTNKGYPAQMAFSKPKKLFRVTVGAFESRKEAAAMASQLQKKEQIKTAIIDLGRP